MGKRPLRRSKATQCAGVCFLPVLLWFGTPALAQAQDGASQPVQPAPEAGAAAAEKKAEKPTAPAAAEVSSEQKAAPAAADAGKGTVKPAAQAKENASSETKPAEPVSAASPA